MKIWAVAKLTTLNWCTGQVTVSLLILPLSSFYLNLIDGNIGINIAKLNMKDFKSEIGRLKRQKVKKQSYKSNKKYVLEIFEALYNGLNMIIKAFEKQILESKYRPEID